MTRPTLNSQCLVGMASTCHWRDSPTHVARKFVWTCGWRSSLAQVSEEGYFYTWLERSFFTCCWIGLHTYIAGEDCLHMLLDRLLERFGSTCCWRGLRSYIAGGFLHMFLERLLERFASTCCWRYFLAHFAGEGSSHLKSHFFFSSSLV